MGDRAVVVGAGIVGLTSAYALHKRGWSVTVLEARRPGFGASSVNAGWVCPSHSDPVPAPGLVRQSIAWMADERSPLYIQPRPSLDLVRWLFTFWRHCNARAYRRGFEALAELNRTTLSLLDSMRDEGIAFEEHRTGIIHVYRSPARLMDTYRHFEDASAYGFEVSEPLIGADLRAIEPALSPAIYGGFWTRTDRQVRPETLVHGLTAYLEQHGVAIRRNEAVTRFDTRGDRLTDVRTSAGRLEVDAVVLAAGAWTSGLARMLDRRLPIEAGKGYALDYEPSPVPIHHALHVDAGRHAVTPFDGMTRLAGTMEFSGINERINPKRAAAIIGSAADTFTGWPTDLRIPRIQTGLRPMSADGLPLIGRLPGWRNVAVATGHGMLGLTLAPATADALAEHLTTDIWLDVLRPFDPARFRR